MDAREDFVGVTADDLATVTAQQVTTARLTYVDREIARYVPGTAPDDLVAIRSNLVAEAAKLHFFQPSLVSDKVADHLNPLILSWFPIEVPELVSGLMQTPETPGTSGAIGTSHLGHGWVSIFGELRNSGPSVESWVSNWHTSLVFPPAPAIGLLSYRFTLYGELVPYLPSVQSGGLWGTLTLAVSGDVNTPIDWSKYAGSYWPVDATLPWKPDGTTGDLAGDVSVTGQIPVHEGKRAVLGMIFVAIASIVRGQVTLLPPAASFVTYLSGTEEGPNTIGRIEYRFEPAWLGKVRENLAQLNKPLLP